MEVLKSSTLEVFAPQMEEVKEVKASMWSGLVAHDAVFPSIPATPSKSRRSIGDAKTATQAQAQATAMASGQTPSATDDATERERLKKENAQLHALVELFRAKLGTRSCVRVCSSSYLLCFNRLVM